VQRSVAPENREAWKPSSGEVKNWRQLAMHR
jgi:hypothetical protein